MFAAGKLAQAAGAQVKEIIDEPHGLERLLLHERESPPTERVQTAFGGDRRHAAENAGERAAQEAGPQRLALHVLHDDEGLGVVFEHFVDGADEGVGQRGGGAGLS